jgi:Flp pilus assembly protein TadG
MTTGRTLRRDESGAAVVELALSLPVLVAMIYGIFEFSQLYEANAGMQHALGEGARLATLYDTTTSDHVPTDAAITAKINAKLFGPAGGSFNVSDPVTAAAPDHYKTLTITYTRTMNFLFFTGPTITLTRTKRVYTTVNV